MDELEGIVEPRVFDPEGDDYEGDVRGAKRARIEPATQAAAPLPVEAPPAPTPTQPMGLLSANALDSLKFMASLRQNAPPAPKPVAKPVSGLGGLAAYGSDSDSD